MLRKKDSTICAVRASSKEIRLHGEIYATSYHRRAVVSCTQVASVEALGFICACAIET